VIPVSPNLTLDGSLEHVNAFRTSTKSTDSADLFIHFLTHLPLNLSAASLLISTTNKKLACLALMVASLAHLATAAPSVDHSFSTDLPALYVRRSVVTANDSHYLVMTATTSTETVAQWTAKSNQASTVSVAHPTPKITVQDSGLQLLLCLNQVKVMFSAKFS